MSEDGVVLVIGSGARQYREYLLAGAARRCPLWLLDSVESTWQQPYVVGTDVIELIDGARLIPDQWRLCDAAARAAQLREVLGVFTYDETLVMATARIAQTLGLPGLSVDGADHCRNKHRTRQSLTAAGLPQPRFALAATLEEARDVASAVGYPLVLKPRGMGASIGVVRVDSAATLTEAFVTAEQASHRGSPAYEGGVLVEQYLRGPEISVDGVVFDGAYRPLFVAHKQVGLAPYFEEIGHIVSAGDPLVNDPELGQVLARAHRALGLRFGITHTEVRFTDSGPVIIEVNARLGGDLIPYLGKLATGIDAARIAVEVAMGIRPTIDTTEATVVGIRFAYPSRDCVVQAVRLPRAGAAPGLLESGALAGPGARLRLPPGGYIGRYAYVICTANDAETCQSRLDAAVRLTDLDADGLLGSGPATALPAEAPHRRAPAPAHGASHPGRLG